MNELKFPALIEILIPSRIAQAYLQGGSIQDDMTQETQRLDSADLQYGYEN
jgi:hypothetical protein